MQIHATADVDSSASLGEDVEIGARAYVGPGAVIGDHCSIGRGSYIAENTQLGENNILYPYVVLGTPPQDMKYHGEETRLVVGDSNVFREFLTINRGTANGEGETRIGDRNFFMISSHVGHDCIVEDETIMVNNVQLGGHCHVEEGAKLMGAAAVNPFVTVGKMAYVGGMTRVVRDVPPFMIMEGNPAKVRGVNEIGLRRAGYEQDKIDRLAEVYKKIYRTRELNRSKIFERIESRDETIEEVRYLVQFLQRSLEGKHGRYRESLRGD